jgi:hypothetical protein
MSEFCEGRTGSAWHFCRRVEEAFEVGQGPHRAVKLMMMMMMMMMMISRKAQGENGQLASSL